MEQSESVSFSMAKKNSLQYVSGCVCEHFPLWQLTTVGLVEDKGEDMTIGSFCGLEILNENALTPQKVHNLEGEACTKVGLRRRA